MTQQHSREEILSLMDEVPVAAIATSSFEGPRLRMMHFAADRDFNIYLATMKGDPKTVQLTHQSSISLLLCKSTNDINQTREIEVIGRASFVRDDKERELALKTTAQRSPVVKYLTESGNAGMLDCLKISPDTVKYRVFGEIVQGTPPTVLEFPQNKQEASDWKQLKTKLKNWYVAIRLPFLTGSLVPVLLGTAIGWFASGALLWGYFILTLLAGLMIHIGSNVLNDYFDNKSGNDSANREFVRPFSGGSRVIQLGLLSPLEVLGGACFFLIASALIGFYLAWARGPLILLLGLIGMISGIFYTGPFGWAKRGIGELVVGLNFGVLMTLGAYYVQTGSFSWLPVIASIPVSLLIAAVLYINEFPDYNADKQVGKNTLVVRLGRQRAAVLYIVIMVVAYLAIALGVALHYLPLPALLGLLTLPLLIRAFQYAVKYNSSSFDLIPANALTVTAHLAIGLLLTLVFTWEALGSQGIVYVVLIGLVFLGFVIWMYRYIERQKNIFLGLKQALR